MKVEFYEETTVQKKERYVADDGTVFETEADCITYEDRRKLDGMPYPPAVSVPALLEDPDVYISLLDGLMTAILHNERFRDWLRTDGEAIYCDDHSVAERIAEFIQWFDDYDMTIEYDVDREAWAVFPV